MVFRKAANSDIPFLINAIIAAEKSGTQLLSYATLFNLSITEVQQLFTEMLEEDVPYQELNVSGFGLVEVDNKVVAATNSWVEPTIGKSSAQQKASLLMGFIGTSRVSESFAHHKFLEDLTLTRTPNAMQFESVFVLPEYRGRGILRFLFDALSTTHNPNNQLPEEIHVVQSNLMAYNAYCKLGFTVVQEKTSVHPDVKKYLPDCTRLKMMRKV